MESSNRRQFACYQRTTERWSQCEGTRIVGLAASGWPAACSGPAVPTRVTRYRTAHVQEAAQHALPLSCLLSHLVDVRRPGKLFMKGYPKIPSCFDALYWAVLETALKMETAYLSETLASTNPKDIRQIQVFHLRDQLLGGFPAAVFLTTCNFESLRLFHCVNVCNLFYLRN
jgi:hypothetical protein